MTPNGTPTQGKILDDLKSMLEVWKDERRSRDISAGLMWENLKYFSVLIIGIITANAFFLKLTIDYPTKLENAGLSLVFPFLIISLAYIGNKDLKRRWKRTLESIAHLNKLEDELGLRNEVPDII